MQRILKIGCLGEYKVLLYIVIVSPNTIRRELMKLVIQGKNIEITDSIHEYVNQKIEKVVSHFQQLTTEVDVVRLVPIRSL